MVSIGDKVLYVLPSGNSKGEIRPGFVVKIWSSETVNLQVLIDGTNDMLKVDGTLWATSVRYSATKEPGTFHLTGD